MKIFSTITFLLLISVKLFSQDIIIKNDKTEIKGRVVEVLELDIKYRKKENPTGPLYTIPKSQIFMILYENGNKDVFETPSTQAPLTTATAPINKPEPSKPSGSTITKTAEQPNAVNETKQIAPSIQDNNNLSGVEKPFSSLQLGLNLDGLGKGYSLPLLVFNTWIPIKGNKIHFGTYQNLYVFSQGGTIVTSTGFGVHAAGNLLALLNTPSDNILVLAGIRGVFNVTNVSYNGNNVSSNSFGTSGLLNCTYFVSKKIGVWGELLVGKGGSTVNLGLALKLKKKS